MLIQLAASKATSESCDSKVEKDGCVSVHHMSSDVTDGVRGHMNSDVTDGVRDHMSSDVTDSRGDNVVGVEQ